MARPTKYKKEYDEQAYKLCVEFGATDKDLAKFFDTTEQTINNWKAANPSFFESIKAGKDEFDTQNVEAALVQRAIGYSHKETKLFNINGQIVGEEVVKHYPPDSTAIIFWLKNRNKDRWSNDNTDRTSDITDALKRIAEGLE